MDQYPDTWGHWYLIHRIMVSWGHWTQIQCTLMLLRCRAMHSCSLKQWVIALQCKVIAPNALRYCVDPSSLKHRVIAPQHIRFSDSDTSCYCIGPSSHCTTVSHVTAPDTPYSISASYTEPFTTAHPFIIFIILSKASTWCYVLQPLSLRALPHPRLSPPRPVHLRTRPSEPGWREENAKWKADYK